MTDLSPAITLPELRRPDIPLFTVRSEPHDVRQHPREHVLHLIVLQCQFQVGDEDYRKERDTSWKGSLGFGSCVVVPGKLMMAYTARHNLMGQKKKRNSTSRLDVASFVPVWAIAISDSNFRAMPHNGMKEWTAMQWKTNLLHFGGRQATNYKTTTPEDVIVQEDTADAYAHTELCILKFEDNLAGALDCVSRFTPGLLGARETHEVIQIGFPETYCTNPLREEWVVPLVQHAVDNRASSESGWFEISNTAPQTSDPQTLLRWHTNLNLDQMEAEFTCRTEDVMAGQDTFTLRLPCTVDRGDSGGAVYLVSRDSSLRGKKFYLLGILARGLSGQHVSIAWPVNQATETELSGAEWQDFLPMDPADRSTKRKRVSALAGGASTSSAI